MPPTALITGGARGIGHAIAADLARDHNVVLTWNSTQPDTLPKGVHAIHADLTQTGRCVAVIEETIAHFGQLDVIVNNAGLGQPTPKDRFDSAAAHAILDVNLLVPAALPHLQPGAAIVSISSINAVLPPRNAALYGASKAALNL